MSRVYSFFLSLFFFFLSFSFFFFFFFNNSRGLHYNYLSQIVLFCFILFYIQSWIKLNADQTGIYRVNYSPDLWSALANAISTSQIANPTDRLGLIADAFALTKAGLMSIQQVCYSFKYILLFLFSFFLVFTFFLFPPFFSMCMHSMHLFAVFGSGIGISNREKLHCLESTDYRLVRAFVDYL